MALRVYLECSPNARNAVHLFHGGASSMSNPFDHVSDETFVGWLNHKNSKQLWLEEMKDLWECVASNEIACKNCVHFDEDCQIGDAQECPQVIAEFNLDEKHFN